MNHACGLAAVLYMGWEGYCDGDGDGVGISEYEYAANEVGNVCIDIWVNNILCCPPAICHVCRKKERHALSVLIIAPFFSLSRSTVASMTFSFAERLSQGSYYDLSLPDWLVGWSSFTYLSIYTKPDINQFHKKEPGGKKNPFFLSFFLSFFFLFFFTPTTYRSRKELLDRHPNVSKKDSDGCTCVGAAKRGSEQWFYKFLKPSFLFVRRYMLAENKETTRPQVLHEAYIHTYPDLPGRFVTARSLRT